MSVTIRALALLLLLAASASAGAMPFRLLLESDVGEPPGDEIFMVTFPTFDDLLAGSLSLSGFSDFGVNDNFSVGGLAFDGQYRVLLESNAGAPAGDEIFLVSFPTFDDLLAGTFSLAGFSSLGVNDNFSVGGLAFDGQFRLLLESDAGAPAGDEIFLATFPTFDDLLGGSQSFGAFSNLGINDAFSVGGLAFDGQYRLLLESDAGAPAGDEVFLVTFSTFDDLLAGTQSSGAFSDLGLNDAFSEGGLAFEKQETDPVPVPLPSSVGLLVAGMVSLLASLPGKPWANRCRRIGARALPSRNTP